MKILYLLGIGIPMIIIFFLIFLSSLEIGFSVEKTTVESVSFNSLFTTSYSSIKEIPIMLINISNDFFMPKKYTLPNLIACLNDKENVKQRENLALKYTEGEQRNERINPSYTGVRNIEIEIIEVDTSYSWESIRSIEIASYSNKQVKVFLSPKYLYNYKTQISQYNYYDEILLIETKEKISHYTTCANLGDKEIENAIRIKLDKSSYTPIYSEPQPSYQGQITGESSCNDSDGGKNYYVKGIVKVKSGEASGEYIDTCNNTILNEWYCSATAAYRRTVNCPNGCLDGSCIKKQVEEKPGYKYILGSASLNGCYRSLNDLNHSKYVKGSTIYENNQIYDSCADSNAVWEVGCFEQYGYTQTNQWRIECDVGELCKDGACIKS